MIYGLFVLAFVSIGLFIFQEVRHNSLLAFCLKGLSSAMFITIFVYGIATTSALQNEPLVVSFFGLGLVFGLIGDLTLALRTLRPEEDNHKIILYGTISFSIGHIFYYSALLNFYQFDLIAVIIAIILSYGTYLASKIMQLNFGPSKIPSIGYSFFLYLVAAQALMMVIALGFYSFNSAVLIGSVLFAASDLVLAQIYFSPKPQIKLIPINLSLYYAAQLLLAFSISLL